MGNGTASPDLVLGFLGMFVQFLRGSLAGLSLSSPQWLACRLPPSPSLFSFFSSSSSSSSSLSFCFSFQHFSIWSHFAHYFACVSWDHLIRMFPVPTLCLRSALGGVQIKRGPNSLRCESHFSGYIYLGQVTPPLFFFCSAVLFGMLCGLIPNNYLVNK